MKELFANLLAYICELFFNFKKTAALPYAGNWNGLGNRLKGMCNFYARGYRNFFMVWSDNNWVSAPFSELFFLDNCKVQEVNSSSKWFGVLQKFIRRFFPQGVVFENKPYWSFILPNELCEKRMEYQWSFSKNLSHSVDWWFDKTPQKVIDYFISFFEHLKPSHQVLKRINDIDCDISKCVCVQARNNNNKNDAKDVCSLNTIISKMKQYPTNTIFFLSCMTDAIYTQMKGIFPGQIFCLNNKDYDSMIDAVADMWLLGHGREIIASPSSTFSEVAWWWGGAKIPVTMLQAEYNQSSSSSQNLQC